MEFFRLRSQVDGYLIKDIVSVLLPEDEVRKGVNKTDNS